MTAGLRASPLRDSARPPRGRIDRRRLIAWGTAFWSLMTALSGLAREVSSLLPPFTLFSLAWAGAGAPGLALNLGAALALALAATALTRLLGTAPQWIALAAALYSVFSWIQGLRLKNREDFDFVFRNPPLILTNLGFGLVRRLSVYTGDLKSALLLALPVQAVAAALLFLAARRLPRA